MSPQADDRELLTTGQVAALMGTTVQHVVNLCLRGELPYTLSGTHRRIRREDALALAQRGAANRGGPLTDDQLRSLWLHRAVAAHVAMDPVGTLSEARASAERLLAREPAGARWLDQWLKLIDRGPEAVMRTLVSTDPLARELRQNSPFLGILPEAERLAVLEAFFATRSAKTGQSMKRDQLEHVLRAAARIVDQRADKGRSSTPPLATTSTGWTSAPLSRPRAGRSASSPSRRLVRSRGAAGVSSATTSRQRSSPPAGTRISSSSMRWWVPISSISGSWRKGSSFCHVTECCPRTSPGREPG